MLREAESVDEGVILDEEDGVAVGEDKEYGVFVGILPGKIIEP